LKQDRLVSSIGVSTTRRTLPEIKSYLRKSASRDCVARPGNSRNEADPSSVPNAVALKPTTIVEAHGRVLIICLKAGESVLGLTAQP